MAHVGATPHDHTDGLIVVEMTISWLDADGLHLVECPPHKKLMALDPAIGTSILAAVEEAGAQAKNAILLELSKRG